MSNAKTPKEDDVLRRMLNTPPTPHAKPNFRFRVIVVCDDDPTERYEYEVGAQNHVDAIETITARFLRENPKKDLKLYTIDAAPL